MIRDRVLVDACNAERACNLQRAVALRQLPQPAEQPLRLATCEDDLAIALEPQCRAREDRQLALLLARRNNGQLLLATGALCFAVRGKRAEQAPR